MTRQGVTGRLPPAARHRCASLVVTASLGDQNDPPPAGAYSMTELDVLEAEVVSLVEALSAGHQQAGPARRVHVVQVGWDPQALPHPGRPVVNADARALYGSVRVQQHWACGRHGRIGLHGLEQGVHAAWPRAGIVVQEQDPREAVSLRGCQATIGSPCKALCPCCSEVCGRWRPVSGGDSHGGVIHQEHRIPPHRIQGQVEKIAATVVGDDDRDRVLSVHVTLRGYWSAGFGLYCRSMTTPEMSWFPTTIGLS